MRPIFLTLMAAVLGTTTAGCAGVADGMSALAGLGVVSEEKATFDGATIVKASPAFLYSGDAWAGVPVQLGARWNDKSPQWVELVLAYRSDVARGTAYLSFQGLGINVDGQISHHDVVGPTMHDSSSYNTVSRTIYTQSTNSVPIPLSLFRKMLAAKDCRLRISTSRGYVDSQFSAERIPGGQPTALLSLREFLARVDTKLAARATSG